MSEHKLTVCSTVKLGNMERFDKEQIGVKEPFLVTCANLLHKDKEHLALRNNLRVTKKFLITSFDCTFKGDYISKGAFLASICPSINLVETFFSL